MAVFKLSRIRAVLLAGAALAGLLTVSAALEHVDTTSAEAASQAAPETTVHVRTMAPQKVEIWSSYSGRLKAVDQAQLRPEVGGLITEVRFRDGDIVKRGDILFVIDPRPFEAAVAKAKADLASARTSAKLANDELGRAEKLIKTGYLSRSVYDSRANAAHVAAANIQAAQATLAQAELDVDHAYVKAPIGGRISRAEITVGNLVQSGANAPLLASIVSNDGIYADFEVDEQTYLKSLRRQAGEGAIPVELIVQSDEASTVRGTLYSFDNQIDTGSGTIRARARFANEDGLVPGMFVSVKLAAHDDKPALLVPERAIGADQGKKFVYVVTPDSRATYREIALGASVADERVVEAGLQPGDRVVLDNIQSVTPGSPVRVAEAVADNSIQAFR